MLKWEINESMGSAFRRPKLPVAAMLAVVLTLASAPLFAQEAAAPNKASQLADIDTQLKTGVISKTRYDAKKKLIEAPPAAADEAKDAGPENMLQNAGFEEFNPNSSPQNSRWPGWGGWCWAGNYEFFKANGVNKHSGDAALGCRCTGAAGRIGLMVKLPITKKDAKIDISVWIKGEGNNKLRVAFESGASGGGEAVGDGGWKLVTFTGASNPDAKSFTLYLYVVGGGTLYLDDAMAVEK